MAKKVAAAKKRNPQDLTLRNSRAVAKRMDRLEAKLEQYRQAGILITSLVRLVAKGMAQMEKNTNRDAKADRLRVASWNKQIRKAIGELQGQVANLSDRTVTLMERTTKP